LSQNSKQGINSENVLLIPFLHYEKIFRHSSDFNNHYSDWIRAAASKFGFAEAG
jgi:hypothetical protein